ncbi:MAG: SAM-dependent methyltransferase [Pseudobdellovibrionaceae bacterium]
MLYLVATPIGQMDEITLRALEVFKTTDLFIVESTKESGKLLRHHGITHKPFEILNEHSTLADVQRLAQLCAGQQVALLTDCGTPGFCDPGAHLVHLCRQKNIPIKSVLGASSLMAVLSLSGHNLQNFYFRGFLPAESEVRIKEWKKISSYKQAIVLMDTPYRLQKTMQQLKEYMPGRKCLLLINVSQPDETQIEGLPQEILKNLKHDKAEFMLLIYPG